ncbi:MAG: hypothetical protein NC548_20555 [Lachnospiraceae bacterium]|nr:hypothetical protein [Lachnospiraceae bacterium]
MDYYAYDAITHVDFTEVSTYAVSDKYAEQQVIYHYQIGNNLPVAMNVEQPDVIILHKTESVSGWPYIISEENIEGFNLKDRVPVYENELYCVYK